MKSILNINNKPIFKVNLFFFLLITWEILIQFLYIPENLYQLVALFLPALVYLILNKEATKRILKKYKLLKSKTFLIIFLIWACVLPFKIFIVFSYNLLFGNKLSDIVSTNPVQYSPWILLFTTALIPALFEELIMRGIILDGYREKKIHVAAIMNGLLFGFLHLNTFQFFHTFITGITTSYLVYITGSILAPMLLHFINNGLPEFLNILCNINKNTSETVTKISNINPSFEIWFYILIISIIGLYLAINLFKKLAEIHNVNLMQNKKYSKEKIFNLPLAGTIMAFSGFSIFLLFYLNLI